MFFLLTEATEHNICFQYSSQYQAIKGAPSCLQLAFWQSIVEILLIKVLHLTLYIFNAILIAIYHL